MLVGAVVFRARADRAQNRLLALALFVDGLHWLTVAARIGAVDAATATAAYATQFPFLLASAVAYLLFLATLETPLTRFLRRRAAVVTIATLGLAVLVLFHLRRQSFLPALLTPGPDPWRWDFPSNDIVSVPTILLAHIAILTFALVAALDTWRRRPHGSAARTRSLAYVLAFGVRDGVLLVNWGVLLLLWRSGTTAVNTSWGAIEILLVPASLLAFCALVGYGILRHQLFDIDLKIKWTIKQSTVAIAFVVVLLVMTEGAQVVFGRDEPWLGIAAAALLVFALAPLQRVADRVADTAMPRVRADDAEYVRLRKADVYRAALEGALVDGEVSARERDMLTRLQLELGLPNTDARTIEREMSARGEQG